MSGYYPESVSYQSARVIARIDAMAFACPYCHASVDQECYNPKTGVPLGKQPAHMKRLIESGWQ